MRIHATLILLLLATPAMAQSRPTGFPTRDVTVAYQIQNGHHITIAFSAVTRRLRVSGMAAPGGYAIVERDGDAMFLVMPQQRVAMRTTEPPAMHDALTMRAFSGFARAGGATVAGLACTVWKVHSARGDGDICVTGDGVLLRARRSGTGGAEETLLQATKVTYRALPDTAFEVPAGYQTMTMPTLPQAPPGAAPKP